ncbi:hypothetical protein IPG41_07270 [Candidatus Peregrinibacteria bacterium]|nr:MAG: hypothetical protein IPG41_07270 [Candidatus Peregrinibacteria bacterium]
MHPQTPSSSTEVVATPTLFLINSGVRNAVADNLELHPEAELSSEVQKVVALLEKLKTTLETKYASTDFHENAKKLFITSPTGKKLAVEIHEKQGFVRINPDNKFRSFDHTDGILQLVPAYLLEVISLEPQDYENYFRGMYTQANAPFLTGSRLGIYDNPIDLQFAGEGLAYGNADLKKVFAAFGLAPSVSGVQKLLTILETLDRQL